MKKTIIIKLQFQNTNVKFYWNKVRGSIYKKDLNEADEQIVHWRKNIFMVPSGAADKKSINKIAGIRNLWTNDTVLKKNYWKQRI